MEEGLKPEALALGAVAVIALGLLSTPEGQRTARQVIAMARDAISKPRETLPPGLKPFAPALKSASSRNGLRVTLLVALVMVENAKFEPNAVRFEAQLENAAWIVAAAKKYGGTPREMATSYGLTQILGATAYSVGHKGSIADLRQKPGVPIELSARYLLERRKRWSGVSSNPKRRDELMLIAYNGGDGAVQKVLAGGTHSSSTYAARVLAFEAQLKGGQT
jgi:soluble lytic murein transglycosylase-like protein